MDVNTIQLIVLVGGFIITLLVFLFARGKEAENRGRLMQRIDELEKVLDELRDRTRTVESNVACHDGDLSIVTVVIEALKKLIEKMDGKLDKLIERREAVRS